MTRTLASAATLPLGLAAYRAALRTHDLGREFEALAYCLSAALARQQQKD